MIKVENDKINNIYEYVSAATPELLPADGALVFGRADSLVAERAVELLKNENVKYLVMLGGIGKDSKYLTRLGIPESHFLTSLAIEQYGADPDKLYVEDRSKNGAECCQFGIEKIECSIARSG